MFDPDAARDRPKMEEGKHYRVLCAPGYGGIYAGHGPQDQTRFISTLEDWLNRCREDGLRVVASVPLVPSCYIFEVTDPPPSGGSSSATAR